MYTHGCMHAHQCVFVLSLGTEVHKKQNVWQKLVGSSGGEGHASSGALLTTAGLTLRRLTYIEVGQNRGPGPRFPSESWVQGNRAIGRELTAWGCAGKHFQTQLGAGLLPMAPRGFWSPSGDLGIPYSLRDMGFLPIHWGGLLLLCPNTSPALLHCRIPHYLEISLS